MNQGHLFLGNSQQSVERNVRHIADEYERKFGRRPELCLVNPNAITDGKEMLVDGVLVKPWRYILPNHFWIGVEDQKLLTQPKAESAL